MSMTGLFYEVRLRGAVSTRVLSIFDEMDMQSDTILRGVVQDQAALHGLLDRIRDLGLELVDVRQLPNPNEPRPRPSADSP
jgi:hypothetical protein